jgi:hypothetical protein
MSILYFDADGLLFDASQNRYFVSTMAKCVRYIAVNETEELICDSDTEERCVTQDSDVGAADQMILTEHLWQDIRSEDRTKII